MTARDLDDVLAVLSTPEDHDLIEIVELVAHLCDAEAAGIVIQQGAQAQVLATHGLDVLVRRAQQTFGPQLTATDDVVAIQDARADGHVDGQADQVRFYASAPIHDPSHRMVGRLCVADRSPRTLTRLQLTALEQMASSLSKLLELRLLQSARLRPADAEVEQAATTMTSQLAAELSHDLRVPLSTIVASTEMLADELGEHPDPAVGALLVRTSRAARRMERMLEQHMHFGSDDEPLPQVVELGKVARQVVLDCTPILEAARARVEIGRLPTVCADPDDLYSLLQNLLSNAVKFARLGVPPIVRISARRTPGVWRISVADNGIGIPEDRRVDIFSLFSRIDSDTEGHGIGLATVARIVHALDGQVGVDTSADGGTEVWLELPDRKEQ